MAANRRIPVIDLFAGPGGLGEGFAALGRPENTPRFDIRLSIEKDAVAHQTLELRAFFRQFDHGDAPTDYYDHLRGELTRDELFKKYPQEARSASEEAWHATLGAIDPTVLRERISSSLESSRAAPRRARGFASRSDAATDPWVLIGGPPCQAYSLVGRSRNKGIAGYTLAADPKARLYLEYLQLIADFWPTVFVMENVRGLLSAKIDNELIFDNICNDLENPAEALKKRTGWKPMLRRSIGFQPVRSSRPHTYSLHALTRESLFAAKSPTPSDFVIRSELYGIPQARHRLIVIGVRDDLDADKLKALTPSAAPTVEEMIGDLPELRSGLSKEPDAPAAWVAAVLELCQPGFLSEPERQRGSISAPRWRSGSDNADCSIDPTVLKRLQQMPTHAKRMVKLGRGEEFIEATPSLAYESDWFVDPRLGGVCNHATRSHIRSDLHRYLFAAAFAEVHHRSPQIAQFPPALLPAHENVAHFSTLPPALRGEGRVGASSPFADRFRVQCRQRYSTTVTSHISKDGHYYIHYNPMQCRSQCRLSLRERTCLATNFVLHSAKARPFAERKTTLVAELAIERMDRSTRGCLKCPPATNGPAINSFSRSGSTCARRSAGSMARTRRLSRLPKTSAALPMRWQ